jgi:predicted TPR repeat methyltransferase
MIDRARARGLYDGLQVGELTDHLRQAASRYDVVAIVDTLCYFGALEDVLSAAKGALRPGGYVVLTAERLEEPGRDERFRLNPHGRYGHAQPYVEEALLDAGLRVRSLQVSALRKERGREVAGLVVAAQRAA